MEKAMKKSKLPQTDSIQKLAEFWDSHDLTDFGDMTKSCGRLEQLKRPF
jgi:hypothetical protein